MTPQAPVTINAYSSFKLPIRALETRVSVGVLPMTIEDSRIIARFQCLLTESLVAKRLGQWRPESKDALYQMLFEELEQRDLKKLPSTEM
jgi:hypothetical protein